MRTSSWFRICLVTSGLALSSYACGGDDDPGDDDADAGTSSSSSGHSSTSGGGSTSSGSSTSGGSTSSGGSSGASSSGGSSSSSSGEPADSGADATLPESDGGIPEDASTDAGTETDASDAGPVVVPPSGAVQYLGRWGDLNDDDADNGPTTSWPGSQAVIRFHGTGLTASIGQTGASIGTSRYDVFVDDAQQPVLAGQTAALVITNSVAAVSYTIASALAEGEHTVRVVRRTEPQQGVNNFKSFTVTRPNAQLLDPPARPTRVIEVLTESTTNGYGVDSPNYLAKPPAGSGNYVGSRVCNDVSLYNDAYQSFPRLLASSVSAELDLLGMSATGITANSGGDVTQKFLTFYPRTNPLVGGDAAGNTWSSAAHPADVVLVLLGGAGLRRCRAAQVAIRRTSPRRLASCPISAT